MGGVGIRRWFGALAGVLLCACGGGASLRTGDLLFQQTRSEEMADAIVAATGDDGAVNFTHVGIVERRDDGLYVIEAVGAYLAGTLKTDPGFQCSHHAHEHGEGCHAHDGNCKCHN